MTQNIKTIRIIRVILGIFFIASGCYNAILNFNHLALLKNPYIILAIISSACFIILGIMLIKKRNAPFLFNRQKIIFFIIFILFAGTWLFYIRNKQTKRVKKMYDIERMH